MTPSTWLETLRTDLRSDAELFKELIAADPDSDEFVRAKAALQMRATPEVLEGASLLLNSNDAARRVVGIRVLAQLGLPERKFPVECTDRLLTLLTVEKDACVLAATASAFYYLEASRGLPELLQLSKHPDARVREGVVNGLTGLTEPGAVSALITLSADENSTVRDWAVFGLGTQIELDTPEIREALWARRNDSHNEAWHEALVGLAHRRDPRIHKLLLLELDRDELSVLVLEAIEEMPSAAFLPALYDWRGALHDPWNPLETAIAKCQLSGTNL
jgi:HEAT repeat protein